MQDKDKKDKLSSNEEGVTIKKEKEDNKKKALEQDALLKDFEKLKEEAEDLRDEKLRILAEMENLRKRFDKEKSETIKFGSSSLAKDILSPCDNLLRALDSLSNEEKENEKNKGLINGLRMVYQEIISILEKHGVKKIEALNNKFDHNYHQAMMEIETEEEESGIVVKELQVGYLMHDRLLRPSMVGVSKKKEKKDQSNK